MKKFNSQGFSVVEGVLIIVVLGILGAVAYVGYNNFIATKSNDQASQNDKKTTPGDEKALTQKLSTKLDTAKKLSPQKLESEADLKEMTEMLKKTNTAEFDTSAEQKQYKELGATFSK